MNKNAYEIRLDILNMAHSDLFSKYHEKLGILRENSNRKNETFDLAHCDVLYPTVQQIAARAQELYAFVEGK
jgi:hypothetical protein